MKISTESPETAEIITSSNAPQRVELFMAAATQLAIEFLKCGGPVTRLENQLSTAGESHGFQTSVTATTTSITLYCHDQVEGKTYGRGDRVSSFYIDLGKLKFVDRILGEFAAGKYSAKMVLQRLQRLKKRPVTYDITFYGLPIFGIGMGAALLTGATIRESLLAAAFTILIQLVVVALHKALGLQLVLREFISCFLAFFLSAWAAPLLSLSPQFLSLGTLIYVVPGLLMTTAISEIVDQNFLSGTIRLLKAFYSFMSMALAFFLAQDLARSVNLDWTAISSASSKNYNIFTLLLGSALIVFSSSIEFRAHRRSLIWIFICGMCGAITYFTVAKHSYAVLSSFAGALAIGLVSCWIGKRFRHPSQIYSMPSILVLVPGMLAFSSFGHDRAHSVAVDIGNQFMIGSLIQALLISLAIVFGLAAGRIPFRENTKLGSLSL